MDGDAVKESPEGVTIPHRFSPPKAWWPALASLIRASFAMSVVFLAFLWITLSHCVATPVFFKFDARRCLGH